MVLGLLGLFLRWRRRDCYKLRFYSEIFEIFVLIGSKYVDISAFISFGNIVLKPAFKMDK